MGAPLLNRKRKLILAYNLLAYFVCLTMLYQMSPFFPPFAEKYAGSTPREIGFIFACLPVGSFAAALPAGSIASRFGHVSTVNIGLCLLAIHTWAFGLCRSFLGWMVCRVGMGVGSTIACTGVTCALGEEFDDDEEFSWVNGLLEATASVAFTLGPFAGGTLYTLGGFSLPFTFSATIHVIFVALSLPLSALSRKVVPFESEELDVPLNEPPSPKGLLSPRGTLSPTPRHSSDDTSPTEAKVSSRDILDMNIFRMFGACFLMTAIWGAMDPYMAQFIHRCLGPISGWTMGMLISIPSIPAGVAALLVHEMRAWISPSTLVVVGLACSGVILACFCAVDVLIARAYVEQGNPVVWVVLVVLLCNLGALNSIGWTPIFPEMVSMASLTMSEQDSWVGVASVMPAVISLFNFASSAGEMVGPVAGGQVCSVLGFSGMVANMSIVFILWSIYMYIYRIVPATEEVKPGALPDLTDRLKDLGVLDEYLHFKANYHKWRQGHHAGAKGELGEKRKKPLKHHMPHHMSPKTKHNFIRRHRFPHGA